MKRGADPLLTVRDYLEKRVLSPPHTFDPIQNQNTNMDPQTLLYILCDKPELTDYVATCVIKYRLPHWEDALEAQQECDGEEDPIETGYWEYMVCVLGGDPETYQPIEPSEYCDHV